MGNFLVTPGIQHNAEYYLSDFQEVVFENSLGSTCFMKVIKAKHKEGPVVVKVFPCPDYTVPLSKYQAKIEEIKRMLTNVPNCLPFRKTLIVDKAGILIRQYIHYNLYDRISTRPFLNSIEKRWIAFQMLYALSQCHRSGVCHGDIKLENILVTGWNWVVLTDFASYKPTNLQENNPAHFNYFFDTSRRRICYIAPERFIKDTNVDNTSTQPMLLEEDLDKGDLVPPMDIFSMGCALIELFTEGQAPFDLEHLLKYNSSSGPFPRLKKVLDKIDDPNIKMLVTHMIQKNPSDRNTAASYLEEQKGKAFPEYFYDFLKDYLTDFAVTPDLSPDEKAAKIHWDIENIISKTKEPGEKKHQPGLVIVVTLLTSCLRSLQHCSAKLHALEAIQALLPHLAPEIILDRLVPYLVNMVKDPYSSVKVAVVKILADALSRVDSIPQSDANIFPEYIFSYLPHLALDSSVSVRVAFAESLASIVKSASRFLQLSQRNINDLKAATRDDLVAFSKESYDREMRTMHNMIQQTVASLLSDADNSVKQTLLEKSIIQLCIFFGTQKTNDVLLSHIFTFLNDKEDWHLRKAFFKQIADIMTVVGFQCCPILKPLLQQGLTDPEEFVVCAVLSALQSLTNLQLLHKQLIYELLPDVAPLLCHPNLWIRHGAVGFIHAVGDYINIADIGIKLMPHITKFMTVDQCYVNTQVALMQELKPPLSRPIFNMLVNQPEFKEMVISILHQTRVLGHSKSSVTKTLSALQQQMLRRFESEGLTEEVENLILCMKDYLLKASPQRHKLDKEKGTIKIDERKDKDLTILHFNLHFDSCLTYEASAANQMNKKQGRKKPVSTEPTTMNEDWQNLFGAAPSSDRPTSPKAGLTSGASTDSGASGSPQPSPVKVVTPVESPVPSFKPYKVSTKNFCVPCQEELLNLVHKKYDEFYSEQLSQGDGHSDDQCSLHSSFLPQGVQVANIREHTGAINRIQALPHSQVFATCSADSTIKLWDCSKMESKTVYNRSRYTYTLLGGDITSMAAAHSGHLAAASDSRDVHVIRIEEGRAALVQSRTMSSTESYVSDMKYYNSGSKQILCLATMLGGLVGWDLRSQTDAWRLNFEPKLGYLTSIAVHPSKCWMLSGTSRGHLICWDLRFLLPVTTRSYPIETKIHKILLHPDHQSAAFTSAQSNNEVSLWNIENGNLDLTLWASETPPFSRTQRDFCPYYVKSMVYLGEEGTQSYLLTGGTDSKIRQWDLTNPEKSKILIPSANSDPSPLPTYKNRVIEGDKLIQEIIPKGIRDDTVPKYPEPPSQGHVSFISDLAVVMGHQPLLASASLDGFLKLWK